MRGSIKKFYEFEKTAAAQGHSAADSKRLIQAEVCRVKDYSSGIESESESETEKTKAKPKLKVKMKSQASCGSFNGDMRAAH